MGFLYVCNTSSDSLSKIDLDKFKEEARIYLGLDRNSVNKIGPHGICRSNGKLIVANGYSNCISIIDLDKCEIKESFFIGMHCNDVEVQEDYAFVTCGELNNLVVVDLNKQKVVEEIPCENSPHSINIGRKSRRILVSNMESNSITIIDYDNHENIKNIKVGEYPTKAIFAKSEKYLLICESNIGSSAKGCLNIMDAESLESIKKIEVGDSPVDIYCDDNYCFVSNFNEGTISVIDINYGQEMKRIEIGGMPRGIIKVGKNIYVGDNYNNLLLQINFFQGVVNKSIVLGKEPNGMLYVEN